MGISVLSINYSDREIVRFFSKVIMRGLPLRPPTNDCCRRLRWFHFAS
jgi:hypothetical protein